ncbi:MAG: hypothetical protein ACAI25_15320, partial [Planctomycetota bacterium]
MTDERLRELERRWLSSRDPAEGWVYARELERIGRRGELHGVLCTLAHGGDKPAAERLDQWRPGDSLGPHRPLSMGRITRLAVLSVPDSPIHLSVRILNSEVAVLSIAGPDARHAGHALDDLSELWRVPDSAWMGCTGDDLILWEGETLTKRSMTGARLAGSAMNLDPLRTSYGWVRWDRAYYG